MPFVLRDKCEMFDRGSILEARRPDCLKYAPDVKEPRRPATFSVNSAGHHGQNPTPTVSRALLIVEKRALQKLGNRQVNFRQLVIHYLSVSRAELVCIAEGFSEPLKT